MADAERGDSGRHGIIARTPFGIVLEERAMQVYGPSQLHGPQSIGAPHSVRNTQPTARPETTSAADSVEISDAARMVEQTREIPDIRQDRVDAIRQQIAAGTYETQAKLNTAVERLLDEIG